MGLRRARPPDRRRRQDGIRPHRRFGAAKRRRQPGRPRDSLYRGRRRPLGRAGAGAVSRADGGSRLRPANRNRSVDGPAARRGGRADPQPDALRAAGAFAEAAFRRQPWRRRPRRGAHRLPRLRRGNRGLVPRARHRCGGAPPRRRDRRLGGPVPAARLPGLHGGRRDAVFRQPIRIVRDPAARRGLRYGYRGGRRPRPRQDGTFPHRGFRDAAGDPLLGAVPRHRGQLRPVARRGGDLCRVPVPRHRARAALSCRRRLSGTGDPAAASRAVDGDAAARPRDPASGDRGLAGDGARGATRPLARHCGRSGARGAAARARLRPARGRGDEAGRPRPRRGRGGGRAGARDMARRGTRRRQDRSRPLDDVRSPGDRAGRGLGQDRLRRRHRRLVHHLPGQQGAGAQQRCRAPQVRR